jgi:hypothetical protein
MGFPVYDSLPCLVPIEGRIELFNGQLKPQIAKVAGYLKHDEFD